MGSMKLSTLRLLCQILLVMSFFQLWDLFKILYYHGQEMSFSQILLESIIPVIGTAVVSYWLYDVHKIIKWNKEMYRNIFGCFPNEHMTIDDIRERVKFHDQIRLDDDEEY